MKQSQLFTKTRKEAPSDEVSQNAKLLVQAGYIYKEFAGAYVLLPLGLRMVQKIAHIIRGEMNLLGGTEIQSTALQSKEVWEATGRFDDDAVDVWFKTALHNGTELGLSFTHEEPLAFMMKNYIASYKDLPVYPYDIRTVFRNEARAKSGLMRGREFFWKALYSFSQNEKEHMLFYEKMKESYMNIFKKLGLGDITYLTFASGGSFAPFSHEFQTLCDSGEDTIYISKEKGIAVNKEVMNDDTLAELGISDALIEAKAVEVGNIFSLGTKYSEAAGLSYTNEAGEQDFVYMGSYGIGISRLLGVIAETLSDDKGLVLPESVAPFKLHLITFGNNENIFREAESLYHDLVDAGIEVLFDDRDLGPGQKLQDADLMGIPYRVIVSEKSLEHGGVEITERKTGDVEYMDASRVLSRFEK